MASQPKAPQAVDPTTIINAQEAANRVNKTTPFGSQTYDSSGNLNTTLPQGTQNAFNNMQALAGNNQQQLMTAPQGSSQLQNAIMDKIGARYGVSTQPYGGVQSSMGNSAKPGGQSMQSPTTMNSQGNIMPTQNAWNSMFSLLGNPQGSMQQTNQQNVTQGLR